MSAHIEFRSHVPVAHRAKLEQLLFFNSCQDRITDSIANAVERFGAPEIVADRDRLRIHMRDWPDAQALFAIESDTGRPVGVAVYTRADLEHVTVMHLCVDAQYASGGERAGEQLLLRLVRELRRSTRRLKGVRKLELYYVKGRAPGSRWRLEGKAAAV